MPAATLGGAAKSWLDGKDVFELFKERLSSATTPRQAAAPPQVDVVASADEPERETLIKKGKMLAETRGST